MATVSKAAVDAAIAAAPRVDGKNPCLLSVVSYLTGKNPTQAHYTLRYLKRGNDDVPRVTPIHRTGSEADARLIASLLPRQSLLPEAVIEKPLPPATPNVDKKLQAQLASALGISLPATVHTTPNKEIEVVPVFMALSGKDRNASAKDLRTICENYPSVNQNLIHIQKFYQGASQETCVASLPLLVELIMLHPSRKAALVRQKCAEVFVRYLGGDLSLIDRILLLPHVRSHLGICEASSHHSPLIVALAAVLSKAPEDLIAIRTVGHTVRNQPTPLDIRGAQSIIDVTMNITGLDSQNSAHAVQTLFGKFPEVCAKVTHFQFEGQGQRDTPVAQLATVVEIIMLLPGRMAALVRQKCAEVFVRYLGGDLSLIGEIVKLNHVQAALATIPPEELSPVQQVARVFGGALQVNLLPAPLIIPAPLGSPDPLNHLYFLRDDQANWIRPGKSKELDCRLVQHRSKFGQHVYNTVEARGFGHVEVFVHRVFRCKRTKPTDERIPGNIDPQQLVDLAVELHKRFMDAPKEEETSARGIKRTFEEAEEDLKIAEIDTLIEQQKTAAEKAKTEARSIAEREMIAVEAARLDLEMKKWEFEQRKKAAVV